MSCETENTIVAYFHVVVQQICCNTDCIAVTRARFIYVYLYTTRVSLFSPYSYALITKFDHRLDFYSSSGKTLINYLPGIMYLNNGFVFDIFT